MAGEQTTCEGQNCRKRRKVRELYQDAVRRIGEKYRRTSEECSDYHGCSGTPLQKTCEEVRRRSNHSHRQRDTANVCDITTQLSEQNQSNPLNSFDTAAVDYIKCETVESEKPSHASYSDIKAFTRQSRRTFVKHKTLEQSDINCSSGCLVVLGDCLDKSISHAVHLKKVKQEEWQNDGDQFSSVENVGRTNRHLKIPSAVAVDGTVRLNNDNKKRKRNVRVKLHADRRRDHCDSLDVKSLRTANNSAQPTGQRSSATSKRKRRKESSTSRRADGESGKDWDKRYVCWQCEGRFCEAGTLKVHMMTHDGMKLFSCGECLKQFTALSTLRTHMRLHSGEKPYQCAVCRSVFHYSSSLYKHMAVHSIDKPYQCTVCDQRFKHSCNLYHHVRLHTREMRYTCTICSRQFVQRSGYSAHMRVHLGDKHFQCTRCTKSFLDRSALISHSRTHTGEQPYSCSQCSRRFSCASNLARHKKSTHDGAKPYACTHCGKQFTNINSVRYHDRMHARQRAASEQETNSAPRTDGKEPP